MPHVAIGDKVGRDTVDDNEQKLVVLFVKTLKDSTKTTFSVTYDNNLNVSSRPQIEGYLILFLN